MRFMCVLIYIDGLCANAFYCIMCMPAMWKPKQNVRAKTYQVVQVIGKFDNVPEFSELYTFSMSYSTYWRYSCHLKSFCCN